VSELRDERAVVSIKSPKKSSYITIHKSYVRLYLFGIGTDFSLLSSPGLERRLEFHQIQAILTSINLQQLNWNKLRKYIWETLQSGKASFSLLSLLYFTLGQSEIYEASPQSCVSKYAHAKIYEWLRWKIGFGEKEIKTEKPKPTMKKQQEKFRTFCIRLSLLKQLHHTLRNYYWISRNCVYCMYSKIP